MNFCRAMPVWLEGCEKELNSFCVFGARFKKAENAELAITACNMYQVFLNGEFIGCGPARAAHGYFRIDKFPLNKLKEENIIFIEVAGYNTLSYWQIDQPAFLQAEILSDGHPIIWSGKDFFVRRYIEREQKVSRFSYQRTASEVYTFLKNPICDYLNVDGFERAHIVAGGKTCERGVGYPLYNEVYPKKILETGRFFVEREEEEPNECFTNKRLKVYPPEEWVSYPAGFVSSLSYEKRCIGNVVRKNEYIVYDLMRVQTGFIKMSLKATEESDILIVFDEIDMNDKNNRPADIRFNRNSCANILEYRLKKAGVYEHMSFEPYSARFLKLLVRKGSITEISLSVVTYENPDTKRFSFRCSDSRLQTIVEAAENTFKQNSVDLLTDCPSRERAGWLCDSYFLARCEKMFTGDNRVEQNFLENYALAPKLPNLPDGVLPMCYPADFENGSYIPNWMFFYIIEIYDCFLRTNDTSLVEKSREKVYGALKFFEKYKNSEGLLENLEGWIFVEWSKANDDDFVCGINYPSNMMYAKALNAAGKLYGDEKFLAESEKIKEKIRSRSFNGEFFEDNSIRENEKLIRTGHMSETCQYYAFFTGIATPTLYPELFETLTNKFGACRDERKVYPNVYKSNAFIGNYLRLMMLAEYGKKELLSKECAEYFYDMARRTGTLWENDSPYGSLNHGFAAYACNLLIDYVSGFKGCFGNVLIFSEAGSDIDCEIIIPVGKTEMKFSRKDGKESLKIPEGYTVHRRNKCDGCL